MISIPNILIIFQFVINLLSNLRPQIVLQLKQPKAWPKKLSCLYKKCVLPFLQEFQSIDSLNSHGHLPWFHFCFELQKQQHMDWQQYYRSSHPEVFLTKGVLKIRRKFTGERPCRSTILIKLLCNFIEITLRHGCSPVNLLHIFRTPFPRNSSGWLLLVLQLSPHLLTLAAPGFFGLVLPPPPF